MRSTATTATFYAPLYYAARANRANLASLANVIAILLYMILRHHQHQPKIHNTVKSIVFSSINIHWLDLGCPGMNSKKAPAIQSKKKISHFCSIIYCLTLQFRI